MTKNTTDYEQACKLRDLDVAQDTERAWIVNFGRVFLARGGPEAVAAHTETELREVIVGMGYDVEMYHDKPDLTFASAAGDNHRGEKTEWLNCPMIDTLVDLLTQILEGEK